MSRRRVLVIDDDTVVRRMIARLLRDREVDTELAATGEDGLRALEGAASLPDAVLCDLYLPGISGVEVIETLRSREDWAALPIVVLTGRARGEMMVRAEELADSCLTKPFSSYDLFDVIERVLGGESPRKVSGA